MNSNENELKPVEVPLLLKQQPKIIFNLTGRQAIFLTCGLAIGFSVSQSFSVFQQSFLVAGFLVGACELVAGIFAFTVIDGRPLEEWFVVLLLWLLTPEQLSIPQLIRLFVKINRIHEDIIITDVGSYQAILVIEGVKFDVLSSSQQEILIKSFTQFLNGLSYRAAIHIRVHPYTPAICETTILPSHLPKVFRSWYSHYLVFLSELVSQRKPTRVTYYLTLTLEDVTGNNGQQRLGQAKVQLAQRIHEVEQQLGPSIALRRLHKDELFLFYYRNFTPQEAPPVKLSLEALAPQAMAIEGRWLEIERKHHHYLACLAVSQLPRRISPGWLQQLVQINGAVSDIFLSIQPCLAEGMTRYLQRKAFALKGALLAAQKRGEESGNTMTRHALGDVERIRDQLMRKDTHLYVLTLFLVIRGSSPEEIETRIKHVESVLRSFDFRTTLLRFQQHLAFFSTFGYGNVLERYSHLVPTNVVACFYPFFNVPTMDQKVLLGATANGDLISLDLWKSFNANMAVIGVPGAGKSFFLKTILSRLAVCEENLRISVIDIEGEYKSFVQALAGSHIIFSTESLQINPFDLRKQAHPQRGDFQEKITALIGLFALLIGEQGVLTKNENALLHMAITETYARAGITAEPETHDRAAPSVDDFVEVLRKKAQAEDIADRLEPYRHLFPHQTEFDASNNITVYNLRSVPEALLPAALYLITEHLWNTLQEARSDSNEEIANHHITVIDEAWFLLKYTYGGVLLNDFARRLRKYGAALWVGTQQIGDALASSPGRDLLSLCHQKLLFRQDASSIHAIQSVLRLHDPVTKYLQTAQSGEAIYLVGDEVYPVEIVASKQEIAMARTARQRGGN